MRAEIISIGTELLLGHILNTNAAYLSRKLAELGIDLYYQTTVGDNPERLIQTIRKAIARSDIVILTGGLGPTIDDVTMESVARLTDRPLVLNKIVLKDIERYFKARGFKPPSGNDRQARVPQGAKCLHNKFGTAPALIVEHLGKVIVCLPGPPREMEPLFEDGVTQYFRKKFRSEEIIRTRTIKTIGLPESRVNAIVKDLLKLPPPTTVGIYAKLREVHLVVMAKAESDARARKAIAAVEKKILSRLKNCIFGYDDDTLESIVIKSLIEKKLTISVAESCTGGLLSKRFTDISGSSGCFVAGIVSYSNESKEKLLGLPKELINKYGAVSGQVCGRMAFGVRHIVRTDIGVGITGIAGPTGGSLRKPVGLVYISLATNEKLIVKEFRFNGSRQDIRWQASQAALDMIRLNI
ncbi:MAG: competence/damage-inducible protein A [Candidatus Omnitrophica bacterium]|nr:competence/damage-inducible protein A [Candidatus Omnitrophota bacterium]